MPGRPVSKKNSHRARVGYNGKLFVGNAEAYLSWAFHARMEIRKQRGDVPTIPRGVLVAIRVVAYFGRGQRELDDDNLLGGPFDVLQAAGVVANDRQLKISGIDRRRDWDNPRVEVTLTPYEEKQCG